MVCHLKHTIWNYSCYNCTQIPENIPVITALKFACYDSSQIMFNSRAHLHRILNVQY